MQKKISENEAVTRAKQILNNAKEMVKTNPADQVLVHKIGDVWGHIHRLELILSQYGTEKGIIQDAVVQAELECKGLELLLKNR